MVDRRRRWKRKGKGKRMKEGDDMIMSILFFFFLCEEDSKIRLGFDSLAKVKDKSCEIDSTGFNPEVTLLERYVKCLCKDGLVDEGIKVCTLLKEKKLRSLLELYHQGMRESEFDIVRIKCLIQALCEGGEVSQAYELLKKRLKQGLDPGHAVYPQLMSIWLLVVLEREASPGVLCIQRSQRERLRTCTTGEFTYSVMVHAHLKRGEVVLAKELYGEMIRNGFG
ncbi:hypothetical protein F2Q70_00007625 [Brassica cretica]|uniref:Pentacotripeptide-repeat region of PRORP domain-containing protein n=1 Tax=Brassica cretica TaxID=69181 RepID=A0A8S9LXI3_BRACR|nr:hypothetical protein F2Q70_00007625 [Brassica cretica]